jgi:hypothetical protein
MQYVKKLSVIALSAVVLVVGYQPASAAPAPTATELAVVGSIWVDSSVSSVGMNGVCAGGGTGGAGLCSLVAWGTASGLNCSTWSGTVGGSINTGTGTLDRYFVRLNVTMTAGTIVITGTATHADGHVSTVVGGGAAIESQGAQTCAIGIGSRNLDWAGSLTIAA